MCANENESISWTGIGGLPFDDAGAALDHVRRCYPTMPFLPELPTPGSGMLIDALPPSLERSPHPGFGVRLDRIGAEDVVTAAFADPRTGVAETPLIIRARRLLPKMEAPAENAVLKAQFAGPVTLLRTVRDAGGIPLWAYPPLREAVATWSAELARELAYALLEVHEPATVWLDEPGLGLAGLDDDAAEVRAVLEPTLDVLRDLEVETGIHCCAEPPVELAGELRLDWFACDAVRYADELAASGAALGRMMSTGTRLVLGCLAVMPVEDDASPLPLVDRLLEATGLDAAAFARALALSPACGTMLAPVAREREIAGKLAEWSAALARHLGAR